MPDFSSRLKSLIRGLSLNNRQLAQMMGTTPSTVGEWTNKGRIPRGAAILKLADTLGTTVKYLLEGDQEDQGNTEKILKIPQMSKPAQVNKKETERARLYSNAHCDENLTQLVSWAEWAYTYGNKEERVALRILLDGFVGTIKKRYKNKKRGG